MLLRINFRIVQKLRDGYCVVQQKLPGMLWTSILIRLAFLLQQNLDLIFHLYLYGLIISFKNWFRDLLRELNKKYEVLLIILFLVFLLFLFSEGLLFVSFFWTTFHSFSFPTLEIWPGEGFYVPDPCELTFANTLLLSNAGSWD